MLVSDNFVHNGVFGHEIGNKDVNFSLGGMMHQNTQQIMLYKFVLTKELDYCRYFGKNIKRKSAGSAKKWKIWILQVKRTSCYTAKHIHTRIYFWKLNCIFMLENLENWMIVSNAVVLCVQIMELLEVDNKNLFIP